MTRMTMMRRRKKRRRKTKTMLVPIGWTT